MISAMRIEFLADRPEFMSELARLHFAEWSYLEPDESIGERIERLRASMGKALPAVIVGLSDGDLLGSAMLVKNDLASRPALSPWLAGVYIKPQYRGHGAAGSLVSRIVELAGTEGFESLYLYTPTSTSMYEHLGWKVIDRCIHNGTPICVMSRAVTSR